MKIFQNIGFAAFLLAMLLFTALLFLSRYSLSDQAIQQITQLVPEKQQSALKEALDARSDQSYHKIAFVLEAEKILDETNAIISDRYEVQGPALEAYLETAMTESEEKFQMTEASRESANQHIPVVLHKTVNDYTGWLINRPYETVDAFRAQVREGLLKAIAAALKNEQIDPTKRHDILFDTMKLSGSGFVWTNKGLLFWLIFGLGVLGSFLYLYPAFFDGNPGIKHNHIYHDSHSSRGIIGVVLGFYLVAFYVLLYFYHHWITEWISLVDPVAQWLRGEDASRWFMYGFLYTVVILVMGIRMLAKYRHSRYHQVRTLSVMFFQTAFAFIIPQLLFVLNQPEMDLKNSWPLNYTFFFSGNIEGHIASGTFGIFLLGWGIALFLVGVPLFTYFYGKRWYCSWVCGCGGLAETLGDPFRQLSDKSTEAWQIERAMIYSVLVFAVVMTVYVLYAFLAYPEPGTEPAPLIINRWLVLGIFWLAGLGMWWYHRKYYPSMSRIKILSVLAVILFSLTIGILSDYWVSQSGDLIIKHHLIKSVYGFAIGSMFAGVIGTGLYPILGNRPWCRFGCPLAAYLGIVQRFKSQFRITTNGGQCISCGNCSTYCEMGIDVRAYAQRGQNIVRSSCVGCGVCAAVCPRGVLSLENLEDDGSSRMDEVRY